MVDYGVLKLTVTSPVQTFAEPVTVSEMRAYLRLPVTSSVTTDEDALIESMIAAARQFAEIHQGRDLVTKQYDLTLDEWRTPIVLRDHLSSVDSITWKDADGTVATLAAGTDYIADTVRGIVTLPDGASWPGDSLYPTSAITVRFTVTPPTPEDRILNGIRYLVANWFEGRLPFNPITSGVMELPFAVTAAFSAGKDWTFA
jgi:uncharacterized phiE125 gp8 family phage protein